jgi:uncharacterized protein DUF3592
MNSNSETRAIGVRCSLAGVLFLVLGIGGYVGMQMAQSHIDRVAEWPSVDGKIVTSEISTTTSWSKYGRRTTQVADIEYAYSVSGQNYQGEHLRLLPMLHMKSDGTPAELVARYPVGRSVQVYYDPSNPSAAVLIPTPGDDARTLIRSVAVMTPCIALMGLVLAGIGAVCLVGKPASAAASAPPAVVAPASLPPVKLGIVQRVMRGAATMLGLFLFLIGSLILVAAAGTPNPSGNESTRIVAMVIFGGAAFLGAGLIYAGIRRPRIKSVATAA